jgi:hypothetical protein
MSKPLAALVLIAVALAGSVAQLLLPATPAFACSIGPVPLDFAAREADAAAIVFIESVGGRRIAFRRSLLDRTDAT